MMKRILGSCSKTPVIFRITVCLVAGSAVGAGLWRGAGWPAAYTEPCTAGPSDVADRATYLQAVTAELEKQWPANRTVNIICHGHSVPAGYFRTPVVDSFHAYPHLLHRSLKGRFPFAVVNVIVTAIGGEDSQSGARRFERDVLSSHPDVVTIDYGLNDRRIGLAKAKVAWQAMISKARAAGVHVILLTPTPDTNANPADPADPLAQHAEQIRNLARTNGVALVDSLRCFQEYTSNGNPLDSLMAQSNHPNARGHEIVAAELLKWFP